MSIVLNSATKNKNKNYNLPKTRKKNYDFFIGNFFAMKYAMNELKNSLDGKRHGY